MVRKIFYLVVTSSAVSAGLLYLGITLLSQFSPAHASSMDALVAETSVQNYADPMLSKNTSSIKETKSNAPLTEPNPSPSISVVSTSQATSNQSPIVGMTSSTTSAQATSVTIAELIKNPKEFEDVVFMLSGIATVLNHEKFLLNDGTGQILVEVEDELISLGIISGLSVTVMGELDDVGDASLEMDACSLSYQNEEIVFDDCIDDDGDDDLNDDDDDMHDDDPDDDLDDDDDTDDEDDTDDDNDSDDVDDDSDDTEEDD